MPTSGDRANGRPSIGSRSWRVPVRQTVGVGRRSDPGELIWERRRSAFAFLTHDWDFEQPERTDGGLVYHRPGLHISIKYWAWKNEQGFATTIRGVDPEGWERSASLGCLYVACGLGPPQAVPEGAGTAHTITKRLAQHASALRQIMPHLQDSAIATQLKRCQGRDLPAD